MAPATRAQNALYNTLKAKEIKIATRSVACQPADAGTAAVLVVVARLKSICRCSYAPRPARALEFQRGQALHFGSCAYPGLWLMAGKRGAGSGLHPLVEFCAGQRSVLVRIEFLKTLADGWQRGGLLRAQLAVLVAVGLVKGGSGCGGDAATAGPHRKT